MSFSVLHLLVLGSWVLFSLCHWCSAVPTLFFLYIGQQLPHTLLWIIKRASILYVYLSATWKWRAAPHMNDWLHLWTIKGIKEQRQRVCKSNFPKFPLLTALHLYHYSLYTIYHILHDNVGFNHYFQLSNSTLKWCFCFHKVNYIGLIFLYSDILSKNAYSIKGYTVLLWFSYFPKYMQGWRVIFFTLVLSTAIPESQVREASMWSDPGHCSPSSPHCCLYILFQCK